MYHELNIGQRRCPKCGWVGSTSIHAKCHCENKSLFDEAVELYEASKDIKSGYTLVDGIDFYPTYRFVESEGVVMMNYIIEVWVGSSYFYYVIPMGVIDKISESDKLTSKIITVHEHEATEGGVTLSYIRSISILELRDLVNGMGISGYVDNVLALNRLKKLLSDLCSKWGYIQDKN